MARGEACVSVAVLMREITISGGGLAGLALASALRMREIPVVVLEAGNYPRHRVCGEFISGVSEETLAALGIAGLFDDALRHETLAWFETGRAIHQDRMPSPALGISRFLLDERLRRHVESMGGTVRTGVRCVPVPQEGGVWAAGRKPSNGPWIGLKAHVRGIAMTADLEMHMGGNGYAGLARIEDGWTNVCGLFRMDRSIRAEPAALLTAYLNAGGNRDLAERLDACERRDGSDRAVAGFHLGRQLPLPGVLSLGDAGCMIPPFTGNGMSMAFQAAEIATEPLLDWSGGITSWQETMNRVRDGLARRFKRRLAVASILHPVLLNPGGRNLVRNLSSSGLLPFRPLLSSVR